MVNSHYDWKNGPALLQQHSVAKHKLLESYLKDYFPTLVSSYQQEELKLTIIDGFAGGGEYHHKDSGDLLLGSPFICLKATEEAEALINTDSRFKKVKFNVDYFFVEKDKRAANYLRDCMKKYDYQSRLGMDINIIEGDFNDHANSIIEFVLKKSEYSCQKVPLNIEGYVPHITAQIHHLLLH